MDLEQSDEVNTIEKLASDDLLVFDEENTSNQEDQELDLLEDETEVIPDSEESSDNNESGKEEGYPNEQQKTKVENPDDLFV
jgi:hypothetical protein